MNQDKIQEFIELLSSSDVHREHFIKNILQINYNNEEYYEQVLIESNLSDESIIKYIDLFNLKLLTKYLKLSEKVLYILIDNDIFTSESINNLLQFQKLNSDMIEQYILEVNDNNLINWNLLQEYQQLSTKFINLHEKYLDWSIISLEQDMDLEFLITNINKLDWSLIPMNNKLQYTMNEGFISLFCRTSIWNNIGWMENINFDTMIKYKQFFNQQTWISILENKDLNSDQLLIIKEYVNQDIIDSIINEL